jgi:hypothetical protein
MLKILIGLVAAIVIAAAGFFGFEFYVQHQIAGQIDAAFDQVRASGGKASHGKLAFDLLHHTVTIADIAAESAAQPPVSVKIGSLTASGVSQTSATRFVADSIEATGIDVDARMVAPGDWHVTYKVPRITVKDYSGPAGPLRQPASSSVIDVYRFVFEQFADITASSVTAPSIVATINFGATTPANADVVTYSGLTIQNIKDGKIAAAKIDDLVFAVNVQQAGKAESITGDLANVAAYDVDIAATAPIFDSQKANDDRYYRIYRQISTGPYVLTSGQGLKMRIEGMTIDDVGLRPSRLQLPALLAMIPAAAAAAPPTPAQAREIVEQAAKLYEGIRIGNAEMRELSIQTPQGPTNLSALRFNLDNGKIGEFALEGLEALAAQGPVKIGRFALKSLDLANLLRWSALHANPAQKPSPDQVLALLPLIEGLELKGLVAPYKNTGKPVNIDTINLDWGHFIGPIPTSAHLTLKMSSPLDATDAAQKMLIAAGWDRAAIDLDLGAAWTETSATFALEPVSLELDRFANASARVSLANVPRGVFSGDPAQAMAAAAQLEAGPITLTLHDTGGIDLAAAQFARSQNINRDAARRAIADGIRANGQKFAANPDAVAAAETLARFVETPGQTLIIKLTPLGKVPALQVMQQLQTDPLTALAQFKIEASTGL